MPSLVFYSICLFMILDVLWLSFVVTRGKEISLTSLAKGLMLFLLVTALRVPFLGGLSFTAFGAISLLYLELTIALPVLSLGLLLWSSRVKAKVTAAARRSLITMLLLGPLLGVYASFIEPRRLQFERASVQISKARAGTAPVKIALFSDIQTYRITEHERRAAALVMAEKPDIVLISGDLFQGSEDDFDAALDDFHAFLRSLDAPGGVYFVEGDAEQWRRTPRLLEGTPVQYLYNEEKKIQVGDRQISLLGLALDYSSSWAKSAMRDLEQRPGDDLRVIVSHRPDSVLFLSENSRVDLVASGHTHGGQVQIPWVGPLLTLTEVPRDVAAGGLHQINGNQIYVSRGLGYEGGQAVPIRFLCPPEVALITLGTSP